MTIIGTAHRICSPGAGLSALVPMPVGTPVILSDGHAHLTDGEACTAVLVDADEWDEDMAAALTSPSVDLDGWDLAEPGRPPQDEIYPEVRGADLWEILHREGPCVVVRLPVETWDEGAEPVDTLMTCLAVRPLDAEAARMYALAPGARGTVLCPACAVGVEAGEDVPGLPTGMGPVARVCDLTDGVCGACGETGEGSWSGYGMYAPVVA